jgi:hypothetical protein
MSAFLTTLSIEYILVLHKESKGIIFAKTSPGVEIEVKILETLQRKIQFNEIELPDGENAITQAAIDDRYVVLRSGAMTYQILIITQKPNRFTRESLHGFGIKFENRWAKEIKSLFEEGEGNTKIYNKDTSSRQSVDKLVDEVFHLEYTLPHRIGIPQGLKKDEQKVFSIGESLARGKGYLLLDELITTASEKLSKDLQTISSIVASFTSRNYMTPIPLEEFLAKYGG